MRISDKCLKYYVGHLTHDLAICLELDDKIHDFSNEVEFESSTQHLSLSGKVYFTVDKWIEYGDDPYSSQQCAEVASKEVSEYEFYLGEDQVELTEDQETWLKSKVLECAD